ncbi:MAG TPA: sugar phosphate isomerase/epimerase [Candidatus Hydrogenedentes bacterium]|nr:sugar phosphate isomerase/epimerase [Candidatus Hydrogenedentota bacterium]
MKIVMHSYTFRTYPLDAAFRAARQFGWEGIELQPCHFDRENIDAELPRCMDVGRAYGVPIACVDFGGDFIHEDPAVVEQSVAAAETLIDACGRHGVALINGGVGSLSVDAADYGRNGSALATEAHYDRAAEAFRHLGPFAGRRGVRIVFEIHMNMLHDTVASTVKLLDKIGCDNVMANPDPGNMFSTSTAEHEAGALERLRGRIGYFHFKNCCLHAGQYNYSVKLADGHIDLNTYVQQLVDLGYDESVCVEYCGEGDPHVAAEEDIRYLRACLDRARGT